MIDPLFTQSRAIAESLLGEIDWAAGGIVRCPGVHLHSKGTSGKRDCKVFLDGDKPPTIYCVHRNGCVAIVAEKNRALRSAIGKAKWQVEHGENPNLLTRPKITKEERERRRKAVALARLADATRLRAEKMFAEYVWLAEDAISPVALPDHAEDDWQLILALFHPQDTVWIGDRTESGHPGYAGRFRPAAEWIQGNHAPAGPLLSASVFKPGVFSRCRESVLRTPFLVVESDILSRDQIRAVFRWLQEQRRLPLRAIIDTGGKSVHGWFDQPPVGDARDELLTVLKALGCDDGPMREPAMSRLPGAWRRDEPQPRRQRLLWFNPSSPQ